VGWDHEESADMLAFLFDWTTKPEFVYSHAWQLGDALMWDNAARCIVGIPSMQRMLV